MVNFRAAFWAGSLKIRRSRMLLMSFLMYIFAPLMMGLLMFIAKNPEIAEKFGIIGMKATVLNLTADWPTYLGFLNITNAAIGLTGFGFVTSWIFGREFSDQTVKDIIALPISRSLIVFAKFATLTILFCILSVVFLLIGILTGMMLELEGWTAEILNNSIYTFVVTSVLTLILCTPVAFFAGVGRGYLVPIGFLIFMMVLFQFFSALGFGAYFPWGIPMLYSMGGGTRSGQIGIASIIIIFLTSITGLIGTLLWWRNADQK